MSTAETIYERAKTLPDNLQAEALRYVDYLLLCRQAEAEDREWAEFAAGQLGEHYGPEDAVYDEE